MQYLLAMIMAMQVPGVKVISGDAYAWAGILPGVTMRETLEKRWGPSHVVDASGRAEYLASQLGTANDDYLPASKVLISYNRSGLVTGLLVYLKTPALLETQHKVLGEEDAQVSTPAGIMIRIWHSRRAVAAMNEKGEMISLLLTA